MKYHLFTSINICIVALSVVQCAPIETSTELNLEIAYLPTTEEPPNVFSYEYTPTDTGYMYNFLTSTSILRDETYEVKNKGTPEEETVISGQFAFKGDDGYRYFIKYIIDKSGNHIEIDRAPIRRIPLSLLKSLVG